MRERRRHLAPYLEMDHFLTNVRIKETGEVRDEFRLRADRGVQNARV